MVTHYMPPHIGGIELVAESLFHAYIDSGAEVRWLASHIPDTTAQREDGRIRVRCCNVLERSLGVPWPIWGPSVVLEIRRLVAWADVLHVHDCLYLGSALAVVLARRARRPVVLSQHIGFVRFRTAALNGIEHLAYRTLGRFVLHRASRLVFCTPGAEEFAVALLGNRPANSVQIPYGIDTSRFRPPVLSERATAREAFGLCDARQVVLFVGRLVHKKGADLFAEVARRHPAVHFLMIGDGPFKPPDLPNLRWRPAVHPADMLKTYHAADILLLPSQGEGFPLAVIEGMATGLPVITSSGEAFTRLLEQQQACVAAERTPDSLSEAVALLCRQQELSAAIARHGRHFVERNLSLARMHERYVALLGGLNPGS
jgi:glycosyltransferase involved in cell wall biosynthesis